MCQLLEQYGHKVNITDVTVNNNVCHLLLQPSHPVPVPPHSTHRHDPVTSLQTFRDILEHGPKLSEIPAKHQAGHDIDAEGNYCDEPVYW